MIEPLFSLDPTDWFVYSDWLYDQGRDEESERAKAIARGLGKTGGLLYLGFTLAEDHMTLSGCCNKGLGPVAVDIGYVWLEKNPRDYGYGISPLNKPEVFSSRPDLVKDYWDKLAEIGKSLRLAK